MAYSEKRVFAASMCSKKAEYGNNGVVVREREQAVDEGQQHLGCQNDVEVLLQHTYSHDVYA